MILLVFLVKRQKNDLLSGSIKTFSLYRLLTFIALSINHAWSKGKKDTHPIK